MYFTFPVKFSGTHLLPENLGVADVSEGRVGEILESGQSLMFFSNQIQTCFFPKMKGFMSLEKCTISKRKSCSNHLSILAFGGVKQHLKNSLDLVPFGDFCRSVTPTVTGSFLSGDNTYKVGPYNLYTWSYNPPIGGFINGQLGL